MDQEITAVIIIAILLIVIRIRKIFIIQKDNSEMIKELSKTVESINKYHGANLEKNNKAISDLLKRAHNLEKKYEEGE
jgi:hypothetical protein